MSGQETIECGFAGCPNAATKGCLRIVQPNGLQATHGVYYACDDHPGILADAVDTWQVTANADGERAA